MVSERASGCRVLHRARGAKQRRTRARDNGVIVSGAAAALIVLTSSGVHADCTNNFNAGGFSFPFQIFAPLGQGGAVNSLVSTINTVNTAFLAQTTAFVSAPGNARPDQQGSGVWARGVGGTVDTDATSVTTIPGITATVLGFPQHLSITGNQTCNTTTRQDYVGYQVGHDISILNGGATGANWHFGVTAGYVETKSKDISAGPPDPTFKGGSNVPFAGIYTSFTKGGFFADGQARWDFFQNHFSDPANTVPGQDFNASGFSLTGNIGYNQPLAGGWFIEPSVGGVWSNVKVDEFNVPGPADPIFGFIAAGTVKVNDIESRLGRASLSIGTNFTTGTVVWQPYFTASVFHEFAGNVTTTLTQNPNFQGPPFGLGLTNFALEPTTVTTSRVGTYGQFALGTAAAILNTGWLGYARVDYRAGENIEGWGVSAGLRYQFSPEQRVSTKDGGVSSSVYSYNWTGPYIGAFAGRTWGEEKWRFVSSGNEVNPEFGGYLFGGQGGYNLQIGQVVVGVEGDYGWTNARGGKQCPGFFFTCEAEADRLASVAGRLGLVWGRALFYGKAGWAAGEVAATLTLNTLPGAVPAVTPVETTKWLGGWTLGGGMEFALTNHWSAKAEYQHYDLGKERFVVSTVGGTPVDVADIETRGDTVRVGVNLHFYPVRGGETPLK